MDKIKVEPDQARPRDGREHEGSVGGLFSRLGRELGLLVRQEIALAKSEITGKFGQLGAGAGLLATAGVLAFAGLLYLMAAGMAALALIVPVWAGALIVAGVALVIAGILAYIGRTKMQADALVPDRTLKTLKDDARLAQEKMQ